MSDMKPNVQEDKDVEIVSDSLGHTQEPLPSHTFCLKNNAAGLSSEEHENPLNGTQPNPFVYSSVPAVPHAGNSLPSGALVNGPGSHPTSEVHCVLNKGTVLSNNVLDAAWQVEKDTSPEVLPPPSELQSDAWKNTAGPAVKTLATQPGVNTPLSHLEENESKLACSALSGDGAEQMHISKPRTKQTIEAGSRHSAERSQSSSDGNGDGEVIRWDSMREGLWHSGRMQETKVTHEREKLQSYNTNVKSVSDSPEKVNNSLNHSLRRTHGGNDAEIADKDNSLDTLSDIAFSVVSKNTALDSKTEQPNSHEDCDAENDPENAFGQNVEQSKAGQLEHHPFFFSCTICNVNFKEKRHFHRHMMYHLGKHNQVNSENVSQAFVCRECGRLFCDRNSLMRHIIIHQDRLEKLLEEIQGLRNLEFEGSGTAVRCPHCVFGCNCPKIFVQHARAGDNLKHYYFCEECNYITLTQQALELHLHVTHLNTNRPQCRKVTNEAQEADHVQVRCKMGFFTSEDKGDLKSHAMPDDQPQTSVFNSDFSTNGKEDASNHKAADENIGSAKSTLSPSLWSINKHGKLLLQPAGKLDVATDLTCVEEDAEQHDQRAFGSTKKANCPATADFLLSARNLKLDQMFCEGSGNDLGSRSLPSKQENQNPPSMGRMLTPKRNSIDKMNGSILPRLSQRHNKHLAVRELERGCEGGHNFSDDTSKATGSFLESSENERNPYARKYFKKRQRFSAKDQSPRILADEGEGDEDCSDIEQLIIKEEYIETTACDNSSASPRTSETGCADVFPSEVAQHKACPYCPAMFESGVGLSNHVRGHLHRAGLSYNARHMVSPEQVALRDHQPPTRKRILTRPKKVRKAVKAENRGEHSCPLCGSCFDTKTGLSNHVRGHLKRMGQSVTSTSKSPLCILTHLLQDQDEHHNIFQELYNGQIPPEPSASPKFIGGRGPVSMHPVLPVKIKYEIKSSRATGGGFVPKQEAEGFSERKKLQAEAQIDIKASTRTLVELLRARRESLELTAGNEVACAARKLCGTAKDFKEEISVEPSWTHGECDSDGGSLPGHLQTFTCRKRIHVPKDAGDVYEQKKPRPGLKKRMLPSLNAQIYTLTCRFCDLVFQGPLSVQEDWIKHLQRHLLHTAVPCSGMGMVEVFGSWSQN